jgi:hypothetical protein
MRKTFEIVNQYRAGLLSASEARDKLGLIARRAKFDRDYSDTLPGYQRFDKMARDATRAVALIGG